MLMTPRDIQEGVKSFGGGIKGQEKYAELVMKPLIQGGVLSNGLEVKESNKPKLEEFSILALWEGFIAPAYECFPNPGEKYVEIGSRRMNVLEAVNSTAFPVVTRMLINQMVIEAYNSIARIGDQLVRTMSSRRKLENIAGFTNSQAPKEVLETGKYEESSIGEKYVVSEATKKGRIISLSEDIIREDQTGQIQMRAQGIGEATAQEREKVIVQGVCDVNGNVYRPAGKDTALYGAPNTKASNALSDWKSLDDAWKHHTNNIKDDRQGEAGEPILWNPNQILVHTDNLFNARRIVNATEVRETTGTAQTIGGNPIPTGMSVLPSPYVDEVGNWYFGEFRRQFIWHEIYPIQTSVQGASSEMAFERDIIARYKVRYFGGISAVDNKYVIKNTP